jgi:hypothetical protein
MSKKTFRKKSRKYGKKTFRKKSRKYCKKGGLLHVVPHPPPYHPPAAQFRPIYDGFDLNNLLHAPELIHSPKFNKLIDDPEFMKLINDTQFNEKIDTMESIKKIVKEAIKLKQVKEKYWKHLTAVNNDGSYKAFPKLSEEYNNNYIVSYKPRPPDKPPTPDELSSEINNNYPLYW